MSGKGMALAAAAVGALVLAAASTAGGVRAEWQQFLAPSSACPGSADVELSPSVQRRAMVCLVNWARKRAGLQLVALSDLLSEAARLKGADVVVCQDFSHTPCGIRMSASVRAVGYPYFSVGENLFFGERESGTAHTAVRLWLDSQPHRENLLAQNWREVGVALRRASQLADGIAVTLWVIQFGQPLAEPPQSDHSLTGRAGWREARQDSAGRR